MIYIGHSQGTTQWFLANTLYSHLHHSYKAFIAMAPVCFLKDFRNLSLETLNAFNIAGLLMPTGSGYYRIDSFLASFFQWFMNHFPNISFTIEGAFLGFNVLGPHLDKSRLPMIATHDFGGTSPKNMLMWLQTMRKQRPSYFDYGPAGNMEHYGAEASPEYDLDVLRERLSEVPMLLVMGERDPFTTPSNMEALMEILPP